MLKQGLNLEYKVGDKSCHFIADNDCTVDFAKESLFQFQKYIGHVEDNVKRQQEEHKKSEEDKKPEEEKSEGQQKD